MLLASGTPKRYRGARTYRQFGCQIGRQGFHATAAGAGATAAGTATAVLATIADSKIVGTALASSVSARLGMAVSH